MTADNTLDPVSHMTGYQWGQLVSDSFAEPLWAIPSFAAGLNKITDLITEGRGTIEVLEIQKAILDARDEFEDAREDRKRNG